VGQRQSLILGLLGLIPFILITVGCFITPPDETVYDLLIFIFVAYAAIVASFLGGVQWGLITASADKIYAVFVPLLTSVIPALVAWSALLTIRNLTLSLTLIIIAFVIASLHDYYLHQKKIPPYWFFNIRLPLSLAVVILASIMLFFA